MAFSFGHFPQVSLDDLSCVSSTAHNATVNCPGQEASDFQFLRAASIDNAARSTDYDRSVRVIAATAIGRT